MSDQPTNLERTLLTERNRLWHESEGLRREVERLTALLKESDDERLALKEHYPKLRADLAAARAQADELRALIRAAHLDGYKAGSADEADGTWNEDGAWYSSDAHAAVPAPPEDDA